MRLQLEADWSASILSIHGGQTVQLASAISQLRRGLG